MITKSMAYVFSLILSLISTIDGGVQTRAVKQPERRLPHQRSAVVSQTRNQYST